MARALGGGISNAEYPDLTSDSPSVLFREFSGDSMLLVSLIRRDLFDTGAYLVNQRDCQHVRLLVV